MNRNRTCRTTLLVASLLVAASALAQDQAAPRADEAATDEQILDEAITAELGRGVGLMSDADFGKAQSAATTCPGTLVALRAITGRAMRSNGELYGPVRRLGELQLYYSAAQDAFCARTMHSDLTWGKTYDQFTDVSLHTCARANSPCTFGNAIAEKDQRGKFRYQAGPISLHGPPSRCVMAFGSAPYVGATWSVGPLRYCPPR